MAWYLRYRPQRVADLHLQSVREQMERIRDSGKFAHAYLFAGPKGTGKTSSARILARLLNEPQNEEAILQGQGSLVEPSTDNPLLQKIATGQSQVVIEQDAASHRGIDDIRQLQEQITVVPPEGFIRVVILDEVHMLTNEAFNALLKMLEEPPERVVFILATTELHKVPATVQSRCQIFHFRKATLPETVQVLQFTATGEGITLSGELAEKIAKAANGSFRDAIKLLEQAVHQGQVDATIVATLTGGEEAEGLIQALAKKDTERVRSWFQEYRRGSGGNFGVLTEQVVSLLREYIHRCLEKKQYDRAKKITDLLFHLLDRTSGTEPIEGIRLELACLAWCLGNGSSPDSNSGGEKTIPCVQEVLATKSVPVETVVTAASLMEPLAKFDRSQLDTVWSKLLLTLRTKSSALESILRNASLGTVNEKEVEVLVTLPFHKERLESAKYANLLTETAREIFGLPGITVRCSVLQSTATSSEADQSAEKDQLLAAVEAAVIGLE